MFMGCFQMTPVMTTSFGHEGHEMLNQVFASIRHSDTEVLRTVHPEFPSGNKLDSKGPSAVPAAQQGQQMVPSEPPLNPVCRAEGQKSSDLVELGPQSVYR